MHVISRLFLQRRLTSYSSLAIVAAGGGEGRRGAKCLGVGRRFEAVNYDGCGVVNQVKACSLASHDQEWSGTMVHNLAASSARRDTRPRQTASVPSTCHNPCPPLSLVDTYFTLPPSALGLCLLIIHRRAVNQHVQFCARILIA